MKSKPSCQDCKHFVRHYVKSKAGFLSLCAGYCIRKRIKKRLAYEPACRKFEGR